MKIAQVAPLYESVPPRLYGGTERIVAYLSDALVDLGHQVTLFASADANTRATLAPMRDQAIRLDPHPLKSDLAANLSMMHEVRLRASEFDVLHFHVDLIHFPFFVDTAPRTMTTLHGRLDLDDLAGAYRRWPDIPTGLHLGQPEVAPVAGELAATVQHGIPEHLLSFNQNPVGDYLAFLGRISPEKRPDRAIAIARCSGLKLKIAAKVDAADRAYFSEVIEPLLADPLIEFVGEIGDAEKSEFLGNAVALLFPIDWPEPFGLVMIEAMACGTPVIAWSNGSVSEVIDQGVTGYVVNSEEEAASAVGRAIGLDRRVIRTVFEHRFGAKVMARNYQQLYWQLVHGEIPGASSVSAE